MCHIFGVIRVADYLYCLMLYRYGTGPWKTKSTAVLTDKQIKKDGNPCRTSTCPQPIKQSYHIVY
jgi:hypothetical protein